jgi:hypothetical protein
MKDETCESNAHQAVEGPRRWNGPGPTGPRLAAPAQVQAASSRGRFLVLVSSWTPVQKKDNRNKDSYEQSRPRLKNSWIAFTLRVSPNHGMPCRHVRRNCHGGKLPKSAKLREIHDVTCIIWPLLFRAPIVVALLHTDAENGKRRSTRLLRRAITSEVSFPFASSSWKKGNPKLLNAGNGRRLG